MSDEKGPLPGHGAASIPVTWKSGNNSLPAQGLVKAPTPHEAAVFSQTRVKTCGGCKHFHHNHGQTVVGKFMAMVLHDAKWKKEFVSEDPKNLGRCGQNAEIMTGPNSMACDQWRAK